MLNAQERLKAVPADPSAAAALRVAVGTPLLAVERVAFTFGGRPVEFRRGLCATHAHHYVNAIGWAARSRPGRARGRARYNFLLRTIPRAATYLASSIDARRPLRCLRRACRCRGDGLAFDSSWL
jgi:hypothetical protein